MSSKMAEYYKPVAYGLLNVVSLFLICQSCVLFASLQVFCIQSVVQRGAENHMKA